MCPNKQNHTNKHAIYSISCLPACLATFSQMPKTIPKTYDLHHFVPAGLLCDLFPNIKNHTKPIYLQHFVSADLPCNLVPNFQNDTTIIIFTAFRTCRPRPALRPTPKYQKGYKKRIIYITSCLPACLETCATKLKMLQQKRTIYAISSLPACPATFCYISKMIQKNKWFSAFRAFRTGLQASHKSKMIHKTYFYSSSCPPACLGTFS